jgi:DDE superfamily endonuclease
LAKGEREYAPILGAGDVDAYVIIDGSVHDKKAEWIWGVIAELEKAGLITLADKGYQGSTWAKTPYKGKNKPESQKEANRAHARLRGPGERANAQLKTWKILSKLRCCPWRAGKLAKAIHVLQLRETHNQDEKGSILVDSLTYPGGFPMPGSDTLHLHQTATNPSQTGWNQLTPYLADRPEPSSSIMTAWMRLSCLARWIGS